ncbi:ABC transporter substrate-binding protein [Betaproteobacteria bacterium]|nr:ABC transporter substrate-binding protein [Betaproteobacteria bacterium]GHU00458.1 ABC transporter substrate-binding protein [Betaproteobacteria bacterium]GHU29455.1 ABC transporter substrate-binding protein [Betaproteobacteria bacterium]
MSSSSDPIKSFRLNRRRLLQAAAASPFILLPGVQSGPAFAQGSRKEPVRIGLVAPFTGATGAYGPDMEKAARITVKLINDAGGILGGRPLEVFAEDSESNPTAGVAAVRKLLEANRVKAIIGFWGTPIAMATRQIILDADKVMMVSCSGDDVTAGDTRGLIWRYQAKSTQWGPAAARILLKQGFKKVSVLALQNPFVGSMVEPFEREIKANGGQILRRIYYNPDQPSYRAEVQQVFGENPQAVFAPALLTDFSSIAKEVYRGGFDAQILSLAIAADAEGRFLSSVGAEVAEGIHHFQPAPPIGSPNYDRFVHLMGGKPGTLYFFAGNTHDQVATIALAIEKAGTLETTRWAAQISEVTNPPGTKTDDVVEALRLVRAGKPLDFIGAGSDCDFNSNGDQINRYFLHQRISGGKQVFVETLV